MNEGRLPTAEGQSDSRKSVVKESTNETVWQLLAMQDRPLKVILLPAQIHHNGHIRSEEYVDEVAQIMVSADIAYDRPKSNKTFKARIRRAEVEGYDVILVIGPDEEREEGVTVRLRCEGYEFEEKYRGEMEPLAELVKKLGDFPKKQK